MDKLIRVREIFRNIFDDMDLVVTPDTAKQDVEDWDSIAYVKLVLTIEEEFGIRFSTEEVASIQSVGDFIRAIDNHLGE